MPVVSDWTHCEWSTHPYFGVAACEKIQRNFPHPEFNFLAPSNKLEHVTAIDLKDSAYIRLISSLDTTQDNHKGIFFKDPFDIDCFIISRLLEGVHVDNEIDCPADNCCFLFCSAVRSSAHRMFHCRVVYSTLWVRRSLKHT
ncbi:MAG: hypothetical protein GF350_07790 [Chitinivibrionales bacterium]|nr:hypothetical protein [Chitinivibrionales bacterium]